MSDGPKIPDLDAIDEGLNELEMTLDSIERHRVRGAAMGVVAALVAKGRAELAAVDRMLEAMADG